jgi:hypothetical protein
MRHLTSSKHIYLQVNSLSELEDIDELDKRDRQSLFPMRALRLASRKDLAVHVSLSSDSIVKQRTNDAFRSETSSPQFFNWVAVCPRNSRETLRKCRVTAASPAGWLYVQLDRAVNSDSKKLRVSCIAPGNRGESSPDAPQRTLETDMGKRCGADKT